VLIEDERHAAGLAEPAIGEADSLGLDELCRRGLMAVRFIGIPFLVGCSS